MFTKAFAERLDSCCEVSVKEAENGDAILPGRVLLAPGNWHMTVTRFGGEPRVALNQNENVNGHRPSVDVLMHSVALEYGSRAVGVIMTGMGKDGAEGLRELQRRGGHVIAQDKESSVIYGMNREVVQNGDANEVVPVDAIAGADPGAAARTDPGKEGSMNLEDRYNLDNLGNRTQELVYQAIERLLDDGTAMCTCEECVTDLAAWTLNHATPRYYTSLLAPLTPTRSGAEDAVEIELALAAGVKKLKNIRTTGKGA